MALNILNLVSLKRIWVSNSYLDEVNVSRIQRCKQKSEGKQSNYVCMHGPRRNVKFTLFFKHITSKHFLMVDPTSFKVHFAARIYLLILYRFSLHNP